MICVVFGINIKRSLEYNPEYVIRKTLQWYYAVVYAIYNFFWFKSTGSRKIHRRKFILGKENSSHENS